MSFLFRKNPKFFTISPANQEIVREVPDNLWVRCGKCNELLYTKEWENAQKVCSKCGYHARLSAYERIAGLLDEQTFQEYDLRMTASDPLAFVSHEPYTVALERSRQKTGLNEAVVYGTGKMLEHPLVIAVCDFGFIGGTMGSVFGEKITRAAELALQEQLPLLIVTASGGARMHEGLLSLMQMTKTSAAVRRLAQASLPYISLLTDPTLGGVTASFATLADVILAEPGAEIGFAGRRVIEQNIHQKLPPNFQTAEFLLEGGKIDAVVPRRELRSVIGKLLGLYANAPARTGTVSCPEPQQGTYQVYLEQNGYGSQEEIEAHPNGHVKEERPR